MLLLAACGGSGDSNGPGVIRGTIEIASGTRTDADTALDLTEQGLDSSRSSPLSGVQNDGAPFPGNVTVGGYVSAESGVYGNGFQYPADASDRLQVNLVEGQRVTVNIFPAPYNPSGSSGNAPVTQLELDPVASGSADSTGSNEEANKSVQAQQDGAHNLIIRARGGGPARYVVRATSLNQGQTLGISGTDILPGEAIVTMESGMGSGRMRTQAGAAVSLAGQQRALGGGQHHVRMPREREALFQADTSRKKEVARTLEWVRELRNEPGVASAVPNSKVSTAAPLPPMTQSEYPDQEWHYTQIGVDAAWEDRTGEGVPVAILDTGIDYGNRDWHPDLAPNIDCAQQGCFDAVDEDEFPEDTGTLSHGTHVAGIAGADALESSQVAGVAYLSKLVPVRVLGSDEGSVADVIEGIRWVINDGSPRAAIINLSLGSQTNNPGLQDAIADAEAAGIIVVGASGNAGDDRQFFPAAYSTVIAVGSVDCLGRRSTFSNFGFWLDVVAPGGGSGSDCSGESSVFSAEADGGTSGRRGTSMAAPHVSGVMAMIKEGNGGLSPAVARALIREGEITQSSSGTFSVEIGRGVIDADAAVGDLSGYAALAPQPEVFELSDEDQEAELRFTGVGSRSASFTEPSVTASEDWLSVDALGKRRFRVSLETGSMEPGVFFRSTLKVSYAVDNESREFELPVTATLESGEENRNAGAHFVQLIPVDSEDPDMDTRQTLVEAEGGRYRFEFDTSEITPGEYFVIAGTDMDNDGIICGPGEACAEYPFTGQAESIEVTPTMNRDLTLETAFTRPVDTQADPGYRRNNEQ
ncbi:hypothetical protein CK501_15500 [Halovibrio salipaludis]|uniref:Peptidase S8/S53 domain-containing protein n=2 Tax=Halovibrio salipaludis TaxID=2032626 RepID=A0A2A2EWN4_9GAMM|nr:hypothetical protein CK501_15500 [Halovibrio salipaludis]